MNGIVGSQRKSLSQLTSILQDLLGKFHLLD